MKNYARINTVLLVVLLFISCVTCFLILRITRTSNNIFSGIAETLNRLDEKLAERPKLNINADQISPESKGAVIAKVGNVEITEGEIDEAIKEIPDWAKENFNQGEGKVEFIRQYVTTQALYEKAKKIGLEQDAQVRRNIKDITKKLLVQRLLEKELKEKIDISPAEIEAYYQENKGKYKEEPKAKLSVIKVSTQENAQDIMRRLEVGADFGKTAQELSEDESTKAQAGAIEGDIERNGYIKGIDAPKEVLDTVFSKKEGELVGPVEIKGAYYIFRVNSITSEKEKPFEEVKELVEYEYKNKKLQDEMQVLLKDVLREEQVEIYTDKILKQDTQESLKIEPEKAEEAK